MNINKAHNTDLEDDVPVQALGVGMMMVMMSGAFHCRATVYCSKTGANSVSEIIKQCGPRVTNRKNSIKHKIQF